MMMMRETSGEREKKEEEKSKVKNCCCFSLPLLLGHVGSEHDHGLVAVFLSFWGSSRKERKKRVRRKRKRGFFRGFSPLLSKSGGRPPALSSRNSASSQRAGCELTRALPSIRARTLRSLSQAPPPIERAKEGGGKESATGAFFFLSCSLLLLSLSSSPRRGAREKKEVEKARESRAEEKRRAPNAAPLQGQFPPFSQLQERHCDNFASSRSRRRGRRTSVKSKGELEAFSKNKPLERCRFRR